MGSDLAKVYTSSVHDQLRLYGAWPIGEEIGLGDYGKLEGDRFVRRGNIAKDYGITVTPAASDVKLSFEFKSSGIAETRFNVDGSSGQGGVGASAAVKVTFANEDSVYFRSIDLTHHCVDNLTDVNRRIMEAFKLESWDGKNVFIHSLFQSGGTTILISSSSDGSIELEAAGKGLLELDLANASAGLVVKSEKNVGLKVIAEGDLSPLLSLSAVRPKNRWLALLGLSGKSVQPLLQTTLTRAVSHPLPGDLISNLDPEISPSIASDLGRDVDDVFQVVEIT